MQLESDLLEPLTSESSFLSPAAQVYSAFYDGPARKLPLLKTMHFVFCLTYSVFCAHVYSLLYGISFQKLHTTFVLVLVIFCICLCFEICSFIL